MGNIKCRTLDDIEKRRVFICDCHSLEHQFALWYDKDLNQIYIEPHLHHTGYWYKKLWGGIKYIFGYKSRFGNWDETLINIEDVPIIRKYLDEVIKEDRIRLENILAEIEAEKELIADRGRD